VSNQTLAAATATSAPATATDSFTAPDDLGEPRASSWQTSLGDSLSTQAEHSFMGGFDTIGHGAEYLAAEHGWSSVLAGFASQQPWLRPNAPDVPVADAKAQVKQEGLEGQLTLPDQGTIRQPVLDLMMNDARERSEYSAAVARGPNTYAADALGFATQIGAGMIDPLNIAAFSIPVLGEARYGKLLASAGESIGKRLALNVGVGAAQGAAGGAALVPADWWLHTQDGQDYTMADALKSVVLSAGMGAAAHGAGNALGDLFARAAGQPLHGTPEDLRARALAGDEHAAELVEQLDRPETASSAAAAGEVQGITPARGQAAAAVSEARHPAEVLADLPPRAQEDVVQASVASLIRGEPVRAGEMLEEAAKADPRIAESVNGTPDAPALEPVTFTTSRGSTYEVHDDGTTTRSKAARSDPGHEGDFGPKEQSARTVYVEDARVFSPPDSARWRVVDHGDGTMSLAVQNADGRWGISPESRSIKYDTSPRVGLRPVELWKPGTLNGLDAYRGVHPGNEITEVRGGRRAEPVSDGEARETAGETSAARGANTRENGRPSAPQQSPDWDSLRRSSAADDEAPNAAPAAEAMNSLAPSVAETPERSVSRARSALAEAEQLLSDILPNLSDGERNAFENALADMKNDEDARAQIVRDGAACMAAASAEAA
jgi:hypothetical protein